MKKIVAVIVLAVIAGLVVADLADSEEKDTVPATTTTTEKPYVAPPTTTTTEDQTYEKALLCAEATNEIMVGLEAVSDGAELLPYVSDAEAAEFLATSREFVQTSLETVELCKDLAPAEAAAFMDALSNLDRILANAEILYG